MILLGLAENSIQLVPDGTIFIHIAIILVMIYVLNATLFKPINRILEERERRTRGQMSEARKTMLSVEEMLRNYERSLREARAEGYRLMEQERALAMRERQEQLSLVREDLNRSIAEQKEAIRAQSEAARATLKTDASRIAREIGEHILHRPISETAANISESRM
ncbi:MAG TPA: ATP synthase F0 subunit B [Pyrinomonadaceae bacterium]|jgi:F-type H+-transporting ATPase subunit b